MKVLSCLTNLISISISLHIGQDWTFSLQGLQVTCPFLHCIMGGREILAHTGHSRFCFRSSGREMGAK